MRCEKKTLREIDFLPWMRNHDYYKEMKTYFLS